MRQAQDAAKSKTLFLSNMSHEMRTPLNGIVGCIGMLKSHPDDRELFREYLGKAESTATVSYTHLTCLQRSWQSVLSGRSLIRQEG